MLIIEDRCDEAAAASHIFSIINTATAAVRSRADMSTADRAMRCPTAPTFTPTIARRSLCLGWPESASPAERRRPRHLLRRRRRGRVLRRHPEWNDQQSGRRVQSHIVAGRSGFRRRGRIRPILRMESDRVFVDGCGAPVVDHPSRAHRVAPATETSPTVSRRTLATPSRGPV